MAVSAPKIFYDNRLKDAVPVASSTAAGDYNVLNLRDWRNYTWWKPSAALATVTVDCGSAVNADSLFVYGEAGTYEVRGSTDNFAASNVLLGTIVLAAKGMGIVTFAQQAFRYWRLRLSAGTPAVAIAAIGNALTLPRLTQLGFDPTARMVKGQVNQSEGGNPLGAVEAFEEWVQTVALRQVDWAWIRSTWIPAWKAHLKTEPFGFAWDPTDHATELFHATMTGGYTSVPDRGTFATLSFEMRARVEF